MKIPDYYRQFQNQPSEEKKEENQSSTTEAVRKTGNSGSGITGQNCYIPGKWIYCQST